MSATPMRRTAARSARVAGPGPAGAAVSETNTDLTKACWAGGTIQIYINPARLRSTAQPTWPTYEQVRTAIRDAFDDVSDPANPGKQVIERIMNKEELRNVDGSDSLHPNRSGDVVVVTRPPYQSDAGTPDQVIALSHFFGQHGYQPDYVDLANNINMHARLRPERQGREAPDRCRRAARRRCRADAVVPDGHPRAAERARGNPLRPHQERRLVPRGHDPRRQRLARATDAACRGV